jgi:lipoate-protein ligase A
MNYLALTLDSPEENLALDEALLDRAEQAGGGRGEVLRLWESAVPLVVLGRSSRLATEVDLEECRARGVRVLRRSSGGATIVAGPGCLMYAVVLSLEAQPELRAIDRAHSYVLQKHIAALRPLCPGVACAGTSDLVVGDRKFSGNSLRIKQRCLLYHGTILYDFPLAWTADLLKTPARQPTYRDGRDHLAFLTNLPVAITEIRKALIATWNATTLATDWPQDQVAELARDRYGQAAWTGEF